MMVIVLPNLLLQIGYFQTFYAPPLGSLGPRFFAFEAEAHVHYVRPPKGGGAEVLGCAK